MELRVSPDPQQNAESFSPAALVHRIRGGERAAEAELVERYRRGVSLILRRSAGPAAADDLYQEVFLLAVEKIRAGEVREPERLSGFICGLARNLAIDYFRRRPPASSFADSGARDAVPDPGASPLERVLRNEDDRSVRDLLSEMTSERDRQILLRFYIGEEDKDRICADLDLTGLQFNRVLYRARERFRELYERAAKGRAHPPTGGER